MMMKVFVIVLALSISAAGTDACGWNNERCCRPPSECKRDNLSCQNGRCAPRPEPQVIIPQVNPVPGQPLPGGGLVLPLGDGAGSFASVGGSGVSQIESGATNTQGGGFVSSGKGTGLVQGTQTTGVNGLGAGAGQVTVAGATGTVDKGGAVHASTGGGNAGFLVGPGGPSSGGATSTFTGEVNPTGASGGVNTQSYGEGAGGAASFTGFNVGTAVRH